MENSKPDSQIKLIGGIEFPPVPFQIVLLDRTYCKRYCLPYKVCLTVTNVRYSVKQREIRYDLLDALFDFPWDEEFCEKISLYNTN